MPAICAHLVSVGRVEAETQNPSADEEILIGPIANIEITRAAAVSQDELMNLTVRLATTGEYYTNAAAGREAIEMPIGRIGAEKPCRLSGSAVQAILDEISAVYRKKRIAAVRVNLLRSGLEQLNRPDGEQTLQIEVVEGKIEKIRCQLRRKAEQINRDDPVCSRIVADSPIGPGDLVRLDILDEYLARLNRHPGRQVDLALAPGRQQGTLILDYILSERPEPLFYSHTSNTGTKQTSQCRYQFGMVHHNLTRADDIFHFSYLTGDFDDVHAVSYGYERPIAHSPQIKTRLSGLWRKYQASELGQIDQEFGGQGYGFKGELAWTFFQKGNFFADAFAGLAHSRVEATNQAAGVNARTSFLTPTIGLRAEQSGRKSRMAGEIEFQCNLADCADTAGEGPEKLDLLGRDNTDRQWNLLKGRLNGSFFLEPLIRDGWDESPNERKLAHEIFYSLGGQVVLNDDRLPANFMQTAGGAYSVRGYPEAFNAGDNTIVGTLEYRYHLAKGLEPKQQAGEFFGRPFRWRPQYTLGPTDWDVLLRGFCDIGRTSRKHRTTAENNSEMLSVGAGAEIVLGENVRLRADWGWALKDADNNNEDVSAGTGRGHVAMTITY